MLLIFFFGGLFYFFIFLFKAIGLGNLIAAIGNIYIYTGIYIYIRKCLVWDQRCSKVIKGITAIIPLIFSIKGIIAVSKSDQRA